MAQGFVGIIYDNLRHFHRSSNYVERELPMTTSKYSCNFSGMLREE